MNAHPLSVRCTVLGMMMMALTLVAHGRSADAEPVRQAHTEVELVAEHEAIIPGEPIHVGLRMKMDAQWHSYWRNPGDSGMPTTIEWQLPDGFEAGDIRWPHPDRFTFFGDLVNYGYGHEIILPVRIETPEQLDTERVTLTARVNWLTCKDVCLPGDATLRIELPVTPGSDTSDEAHADAAHVNESTAELFAAARARQPRALDVEANQRITARQNQNNEELVLHAVGLVDAEAQVDEAYFYVSQGRTLHYSAPQPLRRDGDALMLTLTPSPLRTSADGSIDRLQGVLVIASNDTTRAYHVDVAVTQAEGA